VFFLYSQLARKIRKFFARDFFIPKISPKFRTKIFPEFGRKLNSRNRAHFSLPKSPQNGGKLRGTIRNRTIYDCAAQFRMKISRFWMIFGDKKRALITGNQFVR
jgi:hypothetical protein